MADKLCYCNSKNRLKNNHNTAVLSCCKRSFKSICSHQAAYCNLPQPLPTPLPPWQATRPRFHSHHGHGKQHIPGSTPTTAMANNMSQVRLPSWPIPSWPLQNFPKWDFEWEQCVWPQLPDWQWCCQAMCSLTGGERKIQGEEKYAMEVYYRVTPTLIN